MTRVSLAATLLVAGGALAAEDRLVQKVETIHSAGNPILADGRYYSTDPAPVVIDGKLWILAGRDEAPDGINDFIMNEWQLLETAEPAGGVWRHYPAIARPEAVFAWAAPGRAYAGQIVRGHDGKFYMYAPVMEASSDARDTFAIGVAVADRMTGPWRDAHPAGPIISQRVPEPNTIQNIDPTVMFDDDGRLYIYWGTFGQLRGMELAGDMVTPKGHEIRIAGLTGFFEAPWLMKRKGVYYMLYAGNAVGPDCTPAVYHACIAYGTATAPLGPWTYRGVILKPVSSTTSHSGAVAFQGQWYLAYHTADAVGGNHFRRSVALDRMEWDDSVVPAAIRPVVPTRRPLPPVAASRNIAMSATTAASNQPIPAQYWINALNDGIRRLSPLPPDMWGTWRGADNPAHPWIEYRWAQPVTLNASRIWFWADHPAGAGEGVAPPRSWRIEYWDGGWKPVADASGYGTAAGTVQETRFAAVTTRCLRAAFDASATGSGTAGVAVTEWEVLTPHAGRSVPAPTSDAPPCAR
jgi:hypothetical protein